MQAYYPAPLSMLGIENFALGKQRLKLSKVILFKGQGTIYESLLGQTKVKGKSNRTVKVCKIAFEIFKNQKIPFAWACFSGTGGKGHLQYSSASCCMVTAWFAGDFSCTSYLKFSLHTIFRFTWMGKVKGNGVFSKRLRS